MLSRRFRRQLGPSQLPPLSSERKLSGTTSTQQLPAVRNVRQLNVLQGMGIFACGIVWVILRRPKSLFWLPYLSQIAETGADLAAAQTGLAGLHDVHCTLS